MASSATMRPLGFASARAALPRASARAFSSRATALSARPRALPRTSYNNVITRQTARRWETTDTKIPMPKKKPSGFRTFLKWTWRITYVSVLGGVAYGFYGLHVLKHPNDQEAPDPSKKTLVVLGTW